MNILVTGKAGEPSLGARVPIGDHRLELRVLDVDKDGDLDAVAYFDGVELGSIEVARLAKNVKRAVLKAVRDFRKLFRKKKG